MKWHVLLSFIHWSRRWRQISIQINPDQWHTCCWMWYCIISFLFKTCSACAKIIIYPDDLLQMSWYLTSSLNLLLRAFFSRLFYLPSIIPSHWQHKIIPAHVSRTLPSADEKKNSVKVAIETTPPSQPGPLPHCIKGCCKSAHRHTQSIKSSTKDLSLKTLKASSFLWNTFIIFSTQLKNKTEYLSERKKEKERKKKREERGDSNYRESLACCNMLQTNRVAHSIVTRLMAYSRAS